MKISCKNKWTQDLYPSCYFRSWSDKLIWSGWIHYVIMFRNNLSLINISLEIVYFIKGNVK